MFKKVKVGITGTTSGIGKQLITNRKYKFITFDRIDGDLFDVAMVFKKFKDCDIFINNAYDGNLQLLLLDYFKNKWLKKDKKIMNVGSWVGSYDRTGTSPDSYVKLKRKLRQAHKDIVNSKNKLLCYLIQPGKIDTKLSTKFSGTVSKTNQKMTVKETCGLIWYILEQNLYISDISFKVKDKKTN